MDKSFDPKKIEQHWYDHWEKNNYFTPSGEGTPYCILIPPPNVTGTLHMGHAFQHTLMDALVRYHRMRGDNTLWQPGTDHAGIATQMVVERQLQADGTSRHDLGREAFINKVWEWKAYAGGTITSQMRRLGDSTDWPTEAFTMSDDFKLAVNTVFESLFDEGLIYRGNRLVNWDPVLHTAISDLEVISEEEDGHLWHLRYPVENSDEFVSVATTRPETMLGDTAVAIHPGDERYQHLQGKYVVLPLTSRRIPIIVDDYVDPEFGSGCVKITPAHDHNDWEIGQRHKLEIINILDVNAHILDDLTKAPGKGKSLKEELELVWNAQECRDSIPKKYRGLDRFVARKKIVEDLEKQGFLVKVEPYRVSIPRGDRSGVIVEPLLTDQWYMKMEPLAKPAIEAVERSDIRFVPENWSKTYNQWMHNIQDWCVSRQLWWGHQIPAWYDKHGNTYVAANREAVIQKYNLSPQEELHQDEDVLDTWFSSALWPFATHGWPNDTEALKIWLPSNVLITGFDIIFFWVSRMIMMTLKFTDKVPFKEIFITGLIRDEHGQKMSKSKGNILDPIDLIDGIGLDELIEKRTTGLMQPQLKPKIEKNTRRTFPEGVKPHGTDALRFTLTALASPSRDINFDLGRLEGYRNFCNKIWNASRYVLMNTEGKDCSEGELSNPDKWILFRLAHTVDHIEKYLKTYRFDLVAKEIYEFTWNEFCDWYLELSKTILQSETATDAQKRGTRNTLVTVLETLMRVMHPFMPFITEEIWQRVAPLAGVEGNSVMTQPWPTGLERYTKKPGKQAEKEIERVQGASGGTRKIRAERDIPHSHAVPLYILPADADEKKLIQANLNLIESSANTAFIKLVDQLPETPHSATFEFQGNRAEVPLKGLIDKEAELQRLDKQLEKARKDHDRCEAKLSTSSFVDKAPTDVVEKERDRFESIKTTIRELETQLKKIQSL